MKINVTQSSLPTFEEYCTEIKSIWENHWLTNNGEKVCELEAKLKKYKEVNNIVLYTNGHLALEATISAFQFPIGSEIITTPFTFVSTSNAIVRTGMVPVFCDIEPDNLTLDPKKIEALITSKTVAILPVHVYGNMCDVEEIERIAKKHNLKVIYDSAHAFGVKFKGKNSATFGDISMFSFHATKVFNTIEGGCLAFNDIKYSQILRDMKNFGIRDEEHCLYTGGNAKMNEFQAAMGLCNLRHIDSFISHRKAVCDRYKSHLSKCANLTIPALREGVEGNYSYFPVLFSDKTKRDEIKEILARHDYGSRKYFYPLVSEFDCYKDIKPHDTPIAKMTSERVLCLPLYPDLPLSEVDAICKIILEYV